METSRKIVYFILDLERILVRNFYEEFFYFSYSTLFPRTGSIIPYNHRVVVT